MLKVYAYLFGALVLCLGASAWLINEQINTAPIASKAELMFAKSLLNSNDNSSGEFDNLIKTKAATEIHFDKPIQQKLASGEVVAMLSEQNDVYFYYLQAQQLKVLGPLPRVEPEAHQGIVSGLFYFSVALAVLIVSWPLLHDLNRLRQASKAISQGDFSAQAALGKISPIKRIGDAFDDMAQALKEQNDYQRQLINAVSHDFLTPISRAKFALEINRDMGESSFDSSGVLQDITELEMLVEEFLTYAELNQCQPAIRPSVHHARELLEQACDKFRIYHDIDIAIHCHCDTIEVDRRSFLRIMQNLMSNAIRFAKTTIHVHLQHTDHGIELRVEDDGPGFNDKLSPKLLHAFVKNHQVAKREQTGVGLGLSIISKLCAWNEADIHLDKSASLQGACVRIVF
ncbi:ATP-binding protein [Pseudoalteromonas sp. SSDWG2]|uniref:ATP-binding protein n=1 Tax=Pseudoalteromonas sp. SSDWG2 TaxID=3139391 RepID=UPI003BA9B347